MAMQALSSQFTLRKTYAISCLRDVVKAGKVVHTVEGVCTAEDVDSDGEICDYADTKPLYLKWSTRKANTTAAANQEQSLGNVRVQHDAGEVGGKVIAMDCDDEAKAIKVVTEPIDDEMWRKLKKGFFTGFSHSGRYLYRVCSKCGTDCGEPGNNDCPTCNKWVVVRYACDPSEISYVDTPALASATFTHVKADGSRQVIKFRNVAKGKTKRVAGEDLPASAFAYVGNADDTETWKLPIRFSSDSKTKTHIRNALARFGQTQGIPDGERSQVRARIVAAARRHGITVTNKSQGGDMEVSKSMYHIGWVAEIMSSIRNLRDSNRVEADYEGDSRDAEIADELEEILEHMIDVGRDIYDEETSELTAARKAAKGAQMNELLFKASRRSASHHHAKAAAHHETMAEHHKDLHEEHLAAAETHKCAMDDPECKAMHGMCKAMHGHHKAMAASHLKMHKAHAAHATHHKAMATATEAESEKAAPGGEVVKAAPAVAAPPELVPAVAAPPVPAVAPPVPAPAAAPPVPDVAAPVAAKAALAPAAEGDDPMNLQQTVDAMVEKSLNESIDRVKGSPEFQKAMDSAVSKALMGRLGHQIAPTDVKTAGPTLVPRTENGIAAKAQHADGMPDLSGVPLDLTDLVELELGD